MKTRRRRFIIITIVLLPVIGYLAYAGIRDMMFYYLTVSEVIEKGPQSSNGGVRVGGKVLEGSLNWDSKSSKLSFVMADDRKRLPVVYQGVIPDFFKQGTEVIIEGTYSEGLFRASQIMSKCISSYG